MRGQPIFADARGAISELAFARAAHVEPHSNPNATWFVVIEGGGWVQIGDERARVAAGEAVLWPAEVVHAAWTELSEMRAIVIEFAGADDAALRGIIDGRALALASGLPGETPAVEPGEGTLARPAPAPSSSGSAATAAEGEPE